MIHPLIQLCTKILSKDALFFLVNSYTTGLAPAVLTYMLATELKTMERKKSNLRKSVFRSKILVLYCLAVHPEDGKAATKTNKSKNLQKVPNIISQRTLCRFYSL